MVIRQEGSQWCLFTADGSRKLGCHDTKEQAEAQERAVQANKALLTALNLWPGPLIVEKGGDGEGDEGEFEDLVVETTIIKADDELKVAYGVFLVPFKQDLQGDTVSNVQVTKAAHEFLIRSRRIRDMHREDVKADIVESAIAPPGGMNWYGRYVAEGGWVGAVKVYDPVEWGRLKRGERRGFSVKMRGRKLVPVSV